MKRILYISGGGEFGGIEKLELNYYKYFNNKYIIDILAVNDLVFSSYMELLKNNLYSFNINREGIINKIKYNYRLYKLLKKNKYDIVHINSSVFLFSLQVSLIAKICGVSRVIAHSHSIPYISSIKSVVIKLLRPIYNRLIDYKLSCSIEAIKPLFGVDQDVLIINNGVFIDDYKYSRIKRDKYRKELGIDKYKVYGNVARFSYEKNHELLINLFYKIQQIEDNSILLLIGDGLLFDKIKEKTKKLGIESKVIFLGYQKDINNYLNAMDVFILPSIKEGFGISLIEAELNGLKCFVSNTITSKVIKNKNVYSFEISDNVDNIVNKIINNNIDVREKVNYKLYKDYSIDRVCLKLDKIYRK